jgi:hypothetical protein
MRVLDGMLSVSDYFRNRLLEFAIDHTSGALPSPRGLG